MNIFGWRLTNKPTHIESEEIKNLHKKLDAEQDYRRKQAKAAKKESDVLKKEIEIAKIAEEERIKKQKETNRVQAIVHLRAAERYQESLEQSEGARRSELQAIVDRRLENAANLGFPIKGSSTKALQGLI